MSLILQTNAEYAEKMKTILGLRYDPVAVKLIRANDSSLNCCKVPTEQMSHCQAVFRAKNGECLNMPLDRQSCHVGASALNMIATPEKVASGEFHAAMGMHDSPVAAAKMISDRVLPKACIGELVCPLSKADFEPDVVIIIDIAERVYWIVPLLTAEIGGRAIFSTSPFQCTCEDVTSVPIVTGIANISLGCFGCRKKTDMKADELACGIPYSAIPGYVEHLEKYRSGIMMKAKRD